MNHYLYKITNLINEKYYIGARSTKNNIFTDKYFGSGVALKRAIKKYGKENFIKQILVICPSHEYLYDLEKSYVTNELVSSNDCYNLILGGNYSYNIGRNISVESKSKISNSIKKLWELRGDKYHSDYGMSCLRESGRSSFGRKWSDEKRESHKGHIKKVRVIKDDEELLIDKTCVSEYKKNGYSVVKRSRVYTSISDEHKELNRSRFLEKNPMEDADLRKKVGDSKLGRKKMYEISSGIAKYIKPDEIEYHIISGWLLAEDYKKSLKHGN